MAQPWGAANGAWVAGVAAALEAAQNQHAAAVDAGAVQAAAAAVQAAAATAAWPGQPWGDPISPTELGALLNQWPQAQGPTASQAQPQPPSGWRCLDRTHDPACISCTTPPTPAEYEWFELVGESGKKNGEKKLRSLLAITSEWNSASDRAATAAAAESAGMAELGAALRSKRCACLRKKHFLFLCDTWRYRSDVWARKGGVKRRAGGDASSGALDAAQPDGPRQSQRRRTAPRAADEDDSPSRAPPPPRLALPGLLMPLPPALPGGLHPGPRPAPGAPLLLPSATQPEGALMIVASQLRPLSLEASQLLWGEQARAAASAPGTAAVICRASVEAVGALRREMCDTALFIGTLHTATIAAFMQLPPPGCAEVTVASDGPRSDAELYLTQRLLPWLRRAMGMHATRAAEPDASHAALAWLSELHRACALLAAAAEHASVMLRSARAPGAGMSAALKVECIALEWLAATTCSVHAALLRREAWMTAMVEANVAAGMPPPQQALMSPEELPRPGELVPSTVRSLWRRSSAGAGPDPAGAEEQQQQARRAGFNIGFLPDALFADD